MNSANMSTYVHELQLLDTIGHCWTLRLSNITVSFKLGQWCLIIWTTAVNYTTINVMYHHLSNTCQLIQSPTIAWFQSSIKSILWYCSMSSIRPNQHDSTHCPILYHCKHTFWLSISLQTVDNRSICMHCASWLFSRWDTLIKQYLNDWHSIVLLDPVINSLIYQLFLQNYTINHTRMYSLQFNQHYMKSWTWTSVYTLALIPTTPIGWNGHSTSNRALQHKHNTMQDPTCWMTTCLDPVKWHSSCLLWSVYAA